jgi:hypothetical protein
MTSTYTTNKSIEKPANGDYVNSWNTPVNSDWDIIDKAFGGTTTLNVTGVTSTPVNLTASQYQALIINITGTLTANVTYTIPSGVGGQWIVANNTSGAFTVTISSLGGGSSYTVRQGYRVPIASDGTNIVVTNNLPTASGSSTQVQYNSSGTLAGSSNLTFDGTNLTTTNVVTPTINGITSALEYVFDGGGAPLTAVLYGYLYVPFACTVTGWTVISDVGGSIAFDVYNNPYSSYGSNSSMVYPGTGPNISSSNKGQGSPTSWGTTYIPAGNIIGFAMYYTSGSITRVTVSLSVTRNT